MAHRASNRRRNAWAVSLLDVQREDRVLELGFGPGIAIRELSHIAVDGYVCGIDHSAVMVRQAAKRNAEDIRLGRVDLRLGCAESLPAFEAPFDKVLAVNAMPLRDRPVERLGELRRVLRPGGRIAIAYQPRGPGATDEAAATTGHEIAVLVALGDDAEDAIGEVVEAVQAADDDGFDTAITGEFTLDADGSTLAGEDLQNGELGFGLPAARIVLLVVFGSVVAGLVPLLRTVIGARELPKPGMLLTMPGSILRHEATRFSLSSSVIRTSAGTGRR